MIQLYDVDTSPYCLRVKIVLEEKKLPVEKIPVDLLKKEQKKPEFLALNPNGKVPVLIDEGTIVYESCVVNEYLDEKYPEPPLMPRDPAKRVKVRLFVDYDTNHLNPPFQKIRWELMRREEKRNPEIIEEGKKEFLSLLPRLEQQVDEPYLVGEFSLADVTLIPRFLRVESLGIFPDPGQPRLARWFARMKERPSVRSSEAYYPRTLSRRNN